MEQQRYPRQLWQQEQAGEPQIAKLLAWSAMFLTCAAVWAAIGYSLWRVFFQ